MAIVIPDNISSKASEGERMLTDLSSLGLEFKVMIILWVQKSANACATDLDRACQERRQLYVAMTRAQEGQGCLW